MRYDHHVQIRVDKKRKAAWAKAAGVRRLSLSDFARSCVDAGAVTKLHQADLDKHLRSFRRALNAAAAANETTDTSAVREHLAAVSKLLRKLQRLS